MKRKNVLGVLSLSTALALSGEALAAGGVKFINYYEMILHSLGLDDHTTHDWLVVLASLVTLTIITVIGFIYKKRVESNPSEVIPDGRFSLRTIVESILDFVCNLGENIIGKKEAQPFFPLLCALFLYIFVSNLTGLVPGFIPATESLNTNLAMGLSVFVIYNIAGLREHGASYVKQFLGPVVFLMPLMLIIELVAHLARPVSLSLRLYGNIFGDHLVLSVFTGLTYLVLPAFLLFFGLLVASLQSFVFTLLSGIYISMAVSHDH